MQIFYPSTGQKLIGQTPRLNKEQGDRGNELRVPIEKRIEKIDNHMPEGPPIIDRGLAALRAIAADQLRSAVLAMRQRRTGPTFAAEESPLATWMFFQRGDGGVTQDEFRRLVRHRAPSRKSVGGR